MAYPSGSGIPNANSGTWGSTFNETNKIPTSYLDAGTNANQVVQLDSSAKLPAVDGSQVTNLDVAHIANVTSWGISRPAVDIP